MRFKSFTKLSLEKKKNYNSQKQGVADISVCTQVRRRENFLQNKGVKENKKKHFRFKTK